MQIIDPEDFCGALRSECSFDGVRFKRIIMVLGNENWNRSQAGSSVKCFRMPLDSKDLWFHSSASRLWSEFISFLLLSTQIHLIMSASPCSTEIVSVKLKSGLFNFISIHNSWKQLLWPQVCSWNSTLSVCFNSWDQCEHNVKTDLVLSSAVCPATATSLNRTCSGHFWLQLYVCSWYCYEQNKAHLWHNKLSS